MGKVILFIIGVIIYNTSSSQILGETISNTFINLDTVDVEIIEVAIGPPNNNGFIGVMIPKKYNLHYKDRDQGTYVLWDTASDKMMSRGRLPDVFWVDYFLKFNWKLVTVSNRGRGARFFFTKE